jgi:hypothetical protein
LKDINLSQQENSSLSKKEGNWLKSTRFWLLIYLTIQTCWFWLYSFPLINHFQQISSSLILAFVFILTIFINKKYLLLILIVVALFIDPVFTFSTFTLQFRYHILIGIGVAILLFIKRKELLFIVIVLLIANVSLFIYQQGQIRALDKNFEQKSYVTGEKNRLYFQVDSTIKAENNVYVVLLDGYPSFRILQDSFKYHSTLQDYLLNNSFEQQSPFTLYHSTPISFLHVFGGRQVKGKWPEYSLTSRKFFIEALDSSFLVKNLRSNNYKFEFNSFLTDLVGVNENIFNPIPYWPQFSMNALTYMVYRYIIVGKRIKEPGAFIVKYHKKIEDSRAAALKDTSKKMCLYHYATFHNELKYTMQEEAKFADSLGIDVVNSIIKNDPKATIIVMSDHGERRYLKDEKNFKYGIYAIRKGYISGGKSNK